MEKYENPKMPPSPEYNVYTTEYLRSLFTLLNPLQYYRYPTTNQSSSYVPACKIQATQAEPSLQARENAVRYLLNFNQIEVLRNLPRHRRLARTRINTHKGRIISRTPDYWELNRRRPSVIRRGINSGTKCSSPREAILESNFENDHEVKTYQEIRPVTPDYPPSDSSSIHKGPQLSTNYSHSISPSIPKYPHAEASDVPKDPHLSTNDPQIIHKVPQREHRKSPVIQNTIPFVHREPQPDHVISPITTKRPFVSSSPHSAEDQISPAIRKKQRYSLQSTETSRDLSPRNNRDTMSPNCMPPLIEIPRRRDPLSIDLTTNSSEHSDLNISRNSPKNSTTVKPDTKPLKKEKKYKYSCFHCKKRFRWFSHWQAHERIHTGVRPFKCNQCDRSFTRGDGLQAHMVIHSTKKPHKCSTCSKLFARKSMLDRHIVEHTGIIPYKCEVCQEELADPESIEGHLAQHDGRQKFTCQYCERRFFNGRRLARHIRAHTGEKPFPCSQCKMRFSKKSALIIHHRVHSGVKPFTCSDCGKCFSISGNLRRHLLIHTGERPYPCTKCKKRFNNKSHLARHVSSQHGV